MMCRTSEGIGARLLIVARLLLVAAALLGGTGCSEEACFSWTKQELVNGMCPLQEEALQFFVPSGCYGGIESVDSDGEFILEPDDQIPGDLCCYSVTKSSDDYPFCDGSGDF